jgi:hypothetical protein
MSKIEVDNVVPQSGTNINLGESGDTVTVPAGVTLDTTNSTVTLPDGSVTNAKLANSAITINGSSVSLGGSTTIETGTSWQSTIVTGTTLSAVAGNGYWIDTTSNACTVTLPASASVGDQIIFVDYARNWGTNAITINQNSLNFQGQTSPNPEYNTSGQTVSIVYSGSTQGWIPTSDDDVTLETPQTYSVDFLVIAGGGGVNSTSNNNAGGAGAGGYRSAYNSESSGGGGSSETSLTLNPGTVYTITVGAGGAVGPGTGATAGSNSSIAGSDIINVVSDGGGESAVSSPSAVANNGGPGGSGGGGTGGGSGGSGTANQGFNGGSSGGANSGGGGGGAGVIGSNGSGSNGGAGGNGVASTITGSSVTRGGGGGASGTSSAGAGGTGGGATGNVGVATSGSNGTVNTGGGAGGFNGYISAELGKGGSGVVILRMADADYSGTTTGSPTVTTGVDGTDTVLVFTGSGSYTG